MKSKQKYFKVHFNVYKICMSHLAIRNVEFNRISAKLRRKKSIDDSVENDNFVFCIKNSSSYIWLRGVT